MNTFTMTTDHLKLLQAMYVSWNDAMYEGAPVIDIKRPYGNKDSYMMVGHVLGWWEFRHKDELTLEERTAACKLHRETKLALQIVLCTQSFSTGKYIKTDQFSDRSWRLVQ